MSHASYIYSNIRNLQFLEPHVFIFYWHHHDPIRVIPAGLDWLCPGFHGFIGGLQQDTLEVTYDSKHCWAMAPTRARGVLIDLWMTPLVTPLVMCFGKKNWRYVTQDAYEEIRGMGPKRGTSTSRSCSMVTSGSLMVSAACQPKTQLWATGRFARWEWSEKNRKNIMVIDGYTGFFKTNP